MSLALYVKDPLPKERSPKVERFFYGAMTTVGAAAIGFAVFPLIVWQFSTLPKLEAKVENYPIPQSQVLNSPEMLSNVRVTKDADGFSYFTPEDNAQFLRNLSNLNRPEEFHLTIPKIDVKEAKVKVDSAVFNNNLGHFPGSAIPGEVGNAFITGHSVLPQFADTKNYMAIFTDLPKLEVGDDVEVDLGNKTLHYVVQYSKIVDPSDTSVLLPLSKTGHNLTLMTCVPPGTSLKRLIVVTSLI